jgi:hypothetical protein
LLYCSDLLSTDSRHLTPVWRIGLLPAQSPRSRKSIRTSLG